MKKHFAAVTVPALIALIFFGFSCTKLDTTSLGTDLIPEVDNVNTFADTLDIFTSQGIFTNEDTAKIGLSDAHVLGRIENDPDFGRTTGDIFLQLKPDFFPFYFGNAGDTITAIDSMVLCLSYKGFFGDSTVPQQLQAYEIDPDVVDFFWRDSLYQFKPITYAPALKPAPISAVTTVDIRNLKNYVKIGKGRDSVINQIRIKIDPSSEFYTSLLVQDSTPGGANGFYNDSIFRRRFAGFGVKALSGNALMYTALMEENTRLEVHFKKKRNNIIDTSYSSFSMNQFEANRIKPSASANYLVRDWSTGTIPPAGPEMDELYIQTTPGTFAGLSIPGLTGYPKRIIHRAQIMIEQVPSANFLYDSIFAPPNFLYLDLKDTGSNNFYKPIYEDLNPNQFYRPDYVQGTTIPYYPAAVDFNYYGGVVRKKFDPISGRNISYYVFNVSRFVQKISKAEIPNHDLRVFAPYSFTYPQFTKIITNYNNPLAFGRIKVGGGGNANYKMRMVIIYSRI